MVARRATFHACQHGRPASQDFGSLGHTGLQVHRTHVLNDGAASLLWPKATGDILATLPGTGIDQPAFSIPTMVEPPAQVGCSFGIETAQPVQITCPAQEVNREARSIPPRS